MVRRWQAGTWEARSGGGMLEGSGGRVRRWRAGGGKFSRSSSKVTARNPTDGLNLIVCVGEGESGLEQQCREQAGIAQLYRSRSSNLDKDGGRRTERAMEMTASPRGRESRADERTRLGSPRPDRKTTDVATSQKRRTNERANERTSERSDRRGQLSKLRNKPQPGWNGGDCSGLC